MRRDLPGAARLLLLPTLAVLVVLAFLPGRLGLAARIYGLVLCAIVLWLGLKALRRAYPRSTPLRRPATRKHRRYVPASLTRLEHEAALGVAGAFDLHHRLRPRLRTLATGLLTTRRRVSLDGDPEAVREILGAQTADLIRLDRPPPADRLARGLPINDLRHVVESLERV